MTTTIPPRLREPRSAPSPFFPSALFPDPTADKAWGIGMTDAIITHPSPRCKIWPFVHQFSSECYVKTPTDPTTGGSGTAS